MLGAWSPFAAVADRPSARGELTSRALGLRGLVSGSDVVEVAASVAPSWRQAILIMCDARLA